MILTDPTTTFQVGIDSRLFPEVPAASVAPEDRGLPEGRRIPPRPPDLFSWSDSEEIHIFRLGKRTRTVLHKHRTGILEFVRTQRNVTIRDLPDATTEVVVSSPTWS
jgi:hypothetical protein